MVDAPDLLLLSHITVAVVPFHHVQTAKLDAKFLGIRTHVARLSDVVALGYARVQAWHTTGGSCSSVAHHLGSKDVAFEIMAIVERFGTETRSAGRVLTGIFASS